MKSIQSFSNKKRRNSRSFHILFLLLLFLAYIHDLFIQKRRKLFQCRILLVDQILHLKEHILPSFRFPDPRKIANQKTKNPGRKYTYDQNIHLLLPDLFDHVHAQFFEQRLLGVGNLFSHDTAGKIAHIRKFEIAFFVQLFRLAHHI